MKVVICHSTYDFTDKVTSTDADHVEVLDGFAARKVCPIAKFSCDDITVTKEDGGELLGMVATLRDATMVANAMCEECFIRKYKSRWPSVEVGVEDDDGVKLIDGYDVMATVAGAQVTLTFPVEDITIDGDTMFVHPLYRTLGEVVTVLDMASEQVADA